MTKHDLKELTNLGAELGAAKAENEMLRGLLREAFDSLCDGLEDGPQEAQWSLRDRALAFRIKDALAQQAEPTDTFTAVDMATAAAQGFRDGQAAVEQATAQDEREAFEVEIPDISAIYDGRYLIPYRSLEAGERLMTVAQHLRIEKQLRAALTRPAQTEQQPFGWVTEDYLTDKSATTYDQVVADRWRAKGWPVREIYAAPIAQNEKKPVAMVDANDDGMWADILPDVTVKVGQMLYAAPIAQTSPQPEQSGLVEAASGALAAIQDALEDAYHNAYPECCGQTYLECCGSPLQAWSEADQKTMERFAPHEKALRAALSAQGQKP